MSTLQRFEHTPENNGWFNKVKEETKEVLRNKDLCNYTKLYRIAISVSLDGEEIPCFARTPEIIDNY